jgi:hypothetical protein
MKIRDLVIDFEGEGSNQDWIGKHPTLLGAIIPNPPQSHNAWNYHAYLLNPVLEPMTRPPRDLKGIRTIATLENAVIALVEEAETRRCNLVGYTEHEENIVLHFLDSNLELYKRFKLVYRNIADDVRKYLRSKNRQPKSGELSLERALVLMGSTLQLLPKPSPQGVGEACRKIVTAGTNRKKWKKWVPTQKQVARDLLLYNRRDCEAVRALIHRLNKVGWTRQEPRPSAS